MKYPHRNAESQTLRICKVFRLLGNRCSRCGFDNQYALQVHHKTKGKTRLWDWLLNNYDYSKIELLCANCHSVEHCQNNYIKKRIVQDIENRSKNK